MMGDRIAKLRQRAGLSQAELAKVLGLSTSAVSMYEQGRREPSADVIVAMAAALHTTVDYLMAGRTYLAQNVAAGLCGGDAQKAQLITTVLGAAWHIGGQ